MSIKSIRRFGRFADVTGQVAIIAASLAIAAAAIISA